MVNLFTLLFSAEKDKIAVKLDRDIFYPADKVTGFVILEVLEEICLGEISVKMKGFEYVELGRDEAARKSDSDPWFERTVFLNQKIFLASKKIVLPKGQYSLPFSFQLPSDIPGSFNYSALGFNAKINYQICADCVVSGFFKRHMKKCKDFEFREIPTIDIKRIQTQKDIQLSMFWCFPTGTCELFAQLDKNVYAPGERIQMIFTLSNRSETSNIVSFRIYLQKSIHFRVAGKNKSKRILLTKVDAGSLDAKRSMEKRALLTIPEDQFYTLASAHIKCEYVIVFKIKSSWSFPTKIYHPVQVYDMKLPPYSTIDEKPMF